MTDLAFLPHDFDHENTLQFNVCGYTYKTLAHYIAVQNAAAAGLPFKHFFELDVRDLPPISQVSQEILDDAVNAIVEQTNYDFTTIPNAYECSHKILGLGSNRLRMSFGQIPRGQNLYGKTFEKILKKRKRC